MTDQELAQRLKVAGWSQGQIDDWVGEWLEGHEVDGQVTFTNPDQMWLDVLAEHPELKETLPMPSLHLPFKDDWPVTQVFGVNPADYAQFGMNGHNGIDYGLPMFTDVLAAAGGTVIESRFDAGGYGWTLKVLHPGLGETRYAHMVEGSLADLGAQVDEGNRVGVSNNTGNSSGPHLHFGFRPMDSSGFIDRSNGNGFYGYVDPAPYLMALPTPTPPAWLTREEKAVTILSVLGERTYAIEKLIATVAEPLRSQIMGLLIQERLDVQDGKRLFGA